LIGISFFNTGIRPPRQENNPSRPLKQDKKQD